MSLAARSEDWRISSRPSYCGLSRPEIAEQKAGVALNGGEEMVEVMGDAAGEAPEHLHLPRFAQLPLQPLARPQVPRRHHHALGTAPVSGSVGEGLDASPGAVHVEQPERDRLDRVGSFRDRFEGGQGGLAVIRVKELGERSPAHLVRRPSEKSGQGGARGSDPPFGVEREDEIEACSRSRPNQFWRSWSVASRALSREAIWEMASASTPSGSWPRTPARASMRPMRRVAWLPRLTHP